MKKIKDRVAGSRTGRVILHSICAARDHKLAWHWAGIKRELLHK